MFRLFLFNDWLLVTSKIVFQLWKEVIIELLFSIKYNMHSKLLLAQIIKLSHNGSIWIYNYVGRKNFGNTGLNTVIIRM